ncbi:MAG: hypothetical protein JXP73_13710 [Deltaproteobacteria bacterium]|nr:hypothetical protein [Deltaproteobacteria bacterium]
MARLADSENAVISYWARRDLLDEEVPPVVTLRELSVRQSDGGWAIPLRTARLRYSDSIDVERFPEPIAPVRERSSSHLVTGMVLRAFAAHPTRRTAVEARRAADWFASRLYRRDAYPDRGDPSYWERVSFPFWFVDIVSALDSLSRMGFRPDGNIGDAVERLRKRQRRDGTFALRLLKGKDKDLPWWISLAIHRSLKRWGILA